MFSLRGMPAIAFAKKRPKPVNSVALNSTIKIIIPGKKF